MARKDSQNPLPRLASKVKLPAELVDRQHSKLGHDVHLAAKLYCHDDPDWIRTAENARVRLRETCSHFKPDFEIDPLGTTCNSGSHARPPWRGPQCAHCMFSLVSINRTGQLVHLGLEPSPEEKLLAKIFPPPDPR